jgi:hypothetical protein
MAARSSFNLRGVLSIVTERIETNIALSSIVGEIEVKSGQDVYVPAGGAWVNVPLSFNSGVNELLISHMYTADPLVLEITNPSGSIELGIKGFWYNVFTPGNGIASLRVKNDSTTSNANLVLSYGAKQSADDEPAYWS